MSMEQAVRIQKLEASVKELYSLIRHADVSAEAGDLSEVRDETKRYVVHTYGGYIAVEGVALCKPTTKAEAQTIAAADSSDEAEAAA